MCLIFVAIRVATKTWSILLEPGHRVAMLKNHRGGRREGLFVQGSLRGVTPLDMRWIPLVERRPLLHLWRLELLEPGRRGLVVWGMLLGDRRCSVRVVVACRLFVDRGLGMMFD